MEGGRGNVEECRKEGRKVECKGVCDYNFESSVLNRSCETGIESCVHMLTVATEFRACCHYLIQYCLLL